jgi:predicted nucleic acid-binding protein
LQEFVHQRTRRGIARAEAVAQARTIPAACAVVDVTLADATAALDLLARYPELDARDAVFAAIALQHGIRHVLSPDGAFDAVPGLVRVDPLDAAGVAALGA